MSKGEDKIAAVIKKTMLKNHRYSSFKREVKFNDLKYKDSNLRFDFGFRDNGKLILVEFDGEQHFNKVKFFKNYKHMKENDRRKNQYCIANSIPLYRIPFWDIDKIHSIEDIIQPQYKVTSKYHNDNLVWNKRVK